MQPAPFATKWRAAIWLVEEYPARVDVEIEVPILVRQVESPPHGRDAGVGDQDFAAAQGVERLR